MKVIEALCIAVVGLVSIGLDIVGFFVLVRLVSLRWTIRPILALDRVGQPVVDPLVDAVLRAIPVDWIDHERRRRHVATALTLLVIALCRLGLDGLVR